MTVVGFSVNGVYRAASSLIASSPTLPPSELRLRDVWPSEVPDTSKVSNTARCAAVAALGIENGPSYTQLRVDAEGPKVIEVAARLGGGHDAELVQAVTGVDLNGLTIDAALGLPIEVPRFETLFGGAVTQFLIAPPGVLKAVEIPEDLTGVRSYREAGYIFGPLRRGADRAGAVLVTGASREDAVARAAGGRGPHTLRHRGCRRPPRDGLSFSFQPPASTEAEVEDRRDPSSGWLTTGPRTAEVEARMREYLKAKHVLAVSSCTAALHLALVALGVGPGDEVITTPITWPATANVIVHAGATPVFADVRDDTLNIDPERVRELVKREETKAIWPSTSTVSRPTSTSSLLWSCRSSKTRRTRPSHAYRGRKIGSVADLTCFCCTRRRMLLPGKAG